MEKDFAVRSERLLFLKDRRKKERDGYRKGSGVGGERVHVEGGRTEGQCAALASLAGPPTG